MGRAIGARSWIRRQLAIFQLIDVVAEVCFAQRSLREHEAFIWDAFGATAEVLVAVGVLVTLINRTPR